MRQLGVVVRDSRLIGVVSTAQRQRRESLNRDKVGI